MYVEVFFRSILISPAIKQDSFCFDIRAKVLAAVYIAVSYAPVWQYDVDTSTPANAASTQHRSRHFFKTDRCFEICKKR